VANFRALGDAALRRGLAHRLRRTMPAGQFCRIAAIAFRRPVNDFATFEPYRSGRDATPGPVIPWIDTKTTFGLVKFLVFYL
jgi:hypothetical protein